MRDPSKFRLRFKEYKEGKSVREIYGLPGYQDGLTPIELQIVDNQGVIRQGYPEIPIDKARAWSDKKYTGNSGETFVKNFANNLISTVQDAVEPYREALNLRLTPQGAFRILMDAGMSKAGQAVGKLISDAAKPVANAVSKSESVAYLTPSQMGRRIKENPQLVSNVNVDDAIKDAMWFHENLVLPAWESRGVHIGLDPKDFSIKQADFGDSKLGAIISEDGDIILNSKLSPERQALVIEHEFGGHGAELLKRKIKKLYPKQASLINKWDAKDLFLVNQAYNYSDEFLTPRPGFPKAEESVVLNREVQYLISRDNGWAVGPELLLIIRKMPRARLRRYYAEANAYGKEIIKNAKDPDLMPQRTALMNVPVFGGGLYLANTDPNEYKNGKLPGYKDGTKMLWDADAGVWRQVMDDPYADAFNNLVVTPKYVRPKFEYETNPNYQLPNKNEVVKPDETLWTRQQVEKANNTRTWRSDVADAMKYVQYASDAAGLLYGMAPGIKQRAAKAIYRNVVPASYKDSYLPGGKKQEAVNAIKDFFTPKKLDLDNSAYRKWEQENLSLFFTDTDPVAARDEIYKKYLGLPNDDFYYIKNADGTYSHNLANHEPHDIVTIINNTYNNDMGLSGKNQVLPDMLNSAGGWVNTSLKKVNDVLARFKYKDVWDVNPFQDADRVGNVFPKKLLNKYSHIEKLADGEEVRVWNKDVPWFIKKLQNFELSDFTNGAPVPVKTDINVRLLNPEEYSYTKKLTDTQIIEKMKQLDLSDAYDLYGDAMSDGIISEADWNEIELRVADKVYDTFYKDPNKYRKMFVYNVNHPLKKLFDWYGPFVLLRGYKNGKISIKPSKRGTFTAAAKKHGASVREFESRVLKNPEKYSKAMVRKALFSRNARSWKH